MVDLLHVCRALRLALQIQVRVHQMSRVEHEARIGIADARQELRGELRFLKGQPRPPEIFKEEFTAPRYLTSNRIDELDGRANDFLICDRKCARIHLRRAVMRDVEDEILRLTF